jgi:hypothetical protein
LDDNAYLFLSQSGITDPIITGSIDTFVRGLKSNNLWDKMIAIYPFVGTGSDGVNLTGSHKWNLKEPSLVTYPLSFTGSWNGSTSGSAPSGSNTNITVGGITPSQYYPFFNTQSAHISILSYDTPVSSSYLMGTGMTEDLAISTLAGDYGTPAAAYSVRKVRTAYSGALMDVRRSYDNVTSSIGYVDSGDLDTGSLLDWTIPGRNDLPGEYEGLAAAYSLRKVSGSYTGSAIDVRRIWDNTTSSIGFDVNGNLDTSSLLNFTTSGSNVLLNSNDFSSNAKYSVQVTSSAILGPYGLGSGSFINETSATSFHSFDYNINPVNTSLIHTISCFVKKQERRYVGLAFAYGASVGTAVVFDLNTTSSVFSGSGGNGYSFISASINPIDNDWYRISLTGTTGQADFYPRFFLATSSIQTNIGYASYTGEPGTGSYVYGFQYTTGSTVQPYIETTGTARYNVGNTSSFGYVTQWYDQSGNNRHATQTATGSQPLIVSSGSLVTSSVSKPAMFFNSAAELNLSEINLTGSDYSFFLTYQKTSYNSNAVLFVDGTYNIYYDVSPSNLQGFGNDYISITGGSFPTGSLMLVGGIFNRGVNAYSYKDSILLGSGSATSNNQKVSKLFPASFAHADSFSSEILIYSSSQSSNRPLIENNINNYYNIYTGSNHGFVARWYDQSGNNNHAVMTVTSSQPQIVSSGSTISVNQRSAIYNNSTSLNLTTPLSLGDFTILWVTKRSVTVGSSGVVLGTITAQESRMGDNTDGGGTPTAYRSAFFIGTSTSNSSTGGTENLQHLSYLNRRNGTQAVGQLNNSDNSYNNSVTSANFRVEAISNYRSDYNFLGYYQEIIIYSSDKSTFREPISYGINNYYNIYPQTSSFATSSFTIQATPTAISGAINNRLTSGIPSSGPLGLITVSRTGSNSLTIARNGVTSSFAVPASGALSTGIYLGAINNNGLALGNSPLNLSFASVGTGLTGADLYNLNRLTYNLQGNLGRPDPSAIAFLTAANITDVTQSLAINTLVNDLKSYGIWDKMKVIYPFVGQPGVSSSFEFNLKDPSRFRGTFNGSWNYLSSGVEATANGAYLDTNLNWNNETELNNSSFGCYWNTFNPLGAGVGAYYGVYTSLYSAMGRSNALNADFRLNSAGFYQVPCGLGLHSMTRSGVSTFAYYLNGILRTGNVDNMNSVSKPNLNFWFNGANGLGTPAGRNRHALAYISENLTNVDAANFYTAVQRFQTTLGRQV